MAKNSAEAPPAKRQDVMDEPLKPEILHVYAVMQATLPRLVSVYPPEEETESVLDIYMSLEDANNRVRNEWEDFGDADEDVEEGGYKGDFDGVDNWWSYEDQGGEEEGIKVYIRAMDVQPPGSEPAKEWRRAPPGGIEPIDEREEEATGVDFDAGSDAEAKIEQGEGIDRTNEQIANGNNFQLVSHLNISN